MVGNADYILVGAAVVSIEGTDVGYTKGGTTIRYEPEYIDVMADQAVGVVRKARSLERLYIVTTLLEMTLHNLRRAFMLPAASLATSTLTLGYNDACWVDDVILTIVGKGPVCGTRTYTFDRCVTFGTREISMKREEEQAFEISFEALKDSSGNFGRVVDT